MCKQVQSVATGVLTAEYPVFVLFLSDIGQSNTANGEAAVAAYKALEAAVANFQDGGVITDVESALNAFLAVWNVIPIPASAIELGDVIVAAVEGVLGILGASSVPTSSASADEIKAHQAAYISHASAVIQEKAPSVKVTRLDRAKVFVEGGEKVGQDKFRAAWNPAQERAAAQDAKFSNLKIA